MNSAYCIISRFNVRKWYEICIMYLLPINEKQIIMIANKKTKWWIIVCAMLLYRNQYTYKLLYQSAVSAVSAVSYFCCNSLKEKEKKTNDMVCWHWYVRCVDDAIYVSLFFIFVIPFSMNSIAICSYVVRCKCRMERALTLW